MAAWPLPKAALIVSCQRNRGDFCLINDIDFDIFPRARRRPFAVAAAEKSTAGLLTIEAPGKGRSLIQAAGNGDASVMRKIQRGSSPPPERVQCIPVTRKYLSRYVTWVSGETDERRRRIPLPCNPTVLIIIW